jgi:hypothetical protein
MTYSFKQEENGSFVANGAGVRKPDLFRTPCPENVRFSQAAAIRAGAIDFFLLRVLHEESVAIALVLVRK